MIINGKKTDVAHERFGGSGDTIIEHYIDESLLGGSVVMYAKVILKPGCSLGYHTHTGNSETLVILQGTAEYNDNGQKLLLHPGDTAHCPDGESHSVGNSAASTEDLHIQALIVKSK